MKPIELREADFKKQVETFTYPESVKTEFFEYWTEPNKSGTKMRFELEKTWNLSRRLSRWANNSWNNKPGNHANGVLIKAMKKTEPTTDLEKLDRFFDQFISRPSEIPFDEFGKWYDMMRENKMLRKYSQQEVDELKSCYNGDNSKCRCAVVQQTLTAFANSGRSFKDIIQSKQ